MRFLLAFQFVLNIQADYRACDEDNPLIDLSRSSQGSTIYSPNYPKSFFSQTQCMWSVKAPAGYRVKLVFLELYLPQDASGGCENVYLKVLDSDTEVGDESAKKFQDKGYNICGEGLAPIVSKTGNVVLLLHSNTNVLAVKEKAFKLVLKKTMEAPSVLHDGMVISGTVGQSRTPMQPRTRQPVKSIQAKPNPAFSAQHGYPVQQPMYPMQQGQPMHQGPPMQQQPPQMVGEPVGAGYPLQNYAYNSPTNPAYGNNPAGPPPMGGSMGIGGGMRGGGSNRATGIPTRKDGRVDTTYRQRMKQRAMLKSASAGVAKASPPMNQNLAPIGVHPPAPISSGSSNLVPMGAAAPIVPVVPNAAVPTPQYYIPSSSRSLDEVSSEDITVNEAELSTLALIAIGTGVISVICGITLMLFLYQKRQKPGPDQSYLKYARDHTPVSRHSSFTLEQQRKNKQVAPPRDFMDKKDVEMVRTLSRAPVTEPDEFYLKSSKSSESKDSGFCGLSRKASYITSLKA